MTYSTLDALAEAFPTGTRIRYHLTAERTAIGTVHGVSWSLPHEPGGPREAALVIDTIHGMIGHVYPNEVTQTDQPSP